MITHHEPRYDIECDACGRSHRNVAMGDLFSVKAGWFYVSSRDGRHYDICDTCSSAFTLPQLRESAELRGAEPQPKTFKGDDT